MRFTFVLGAGVVLSLFCAGTNGQDPRDSKRYTLGELDTPEESLKKFDFLPRYGHLRPTGDFGRTWVTRLNQVKSETRSCSGLRVQISEFFLTKRAFPVVRGKPYYKKVTLECRAARQAVGVMDTGKFCFNDFMDSTVIVKVPVQPRIVVDRAYFDLKKDDEQDRYTYKKDSGAGEYLADIKFPSTAGRPAVQCAIRQRRKILGVFRVSHKSLRDESVRSGPFSDEIFSMVAGGQRRDIHDSGLEVRRRLDLKRWFKERKVKGDTVDYMAGLPAGAVHGTFTCDRYVKSDAVGGSRAVDIFATFRTNDMTKSYTFAPEQRVCPLVFSHRAVVGQDDQENSLGALIATQRAGIQGAEVDVFPSQLGPIISHDKTFERQLGLDVSVEDAAEDASGLTVTMLEQATNCEVFTTLDYFLKTVADGALLVDLDLKPIAPSVLRGAKKKAHAFAQEVKDTIVKHRLQDRVVVSAMDPEKLVPFGGRGGTIRVAHARHAGLGKVVSFVGDMMGTMDNDIDPSVPRALVMDYRLAKREIVREAHRFDRPVGVYTVFKAEENGLDKQPSHDIKTITKLINMGVDWIETDDPIRLWNLIYKHCVLPRGLDKALQSITGKAGVLRKNAPKEDQQEKGAESEVDDEDEDGDEDEKKKELKEKEQEGRVDEEEEEEEDEGAGK